MSTHEHLATHPGVHQTTDGTLRYHPVKKGIAILFLALYVFNLAGYYVVFKTLQYQVRSGVKTRIKESVPREELVLIALKQGREDGLQWLDRKEFRYRGGMYDVVRSYSRNDTTFYSCVNDKQEEVLFAHLDLHVATQANLEGTPQKAAAPFQGITKEYVPLSRILELVTFNEVLMRITPDPNSTSYAEDVPTPPPRLV